MNPRGIFSFILVLLFINLIVVSAGINSSTGREIGETINILIELENASLKRAELEQNLDFLIKKVVEREVFFGNSEPELIEQRLNQEIDFFVSRTESIYSATPKLEFNLVQDFQRLKIPQKNARRKLGKGELHNYFNVMVLNLEENIFVVEFDYSGGLMKDHRFFAVISSPKTGQLFEIPAGYTQIIMVVR